MIKKIEIDEISKGNKKKKKLVKGFTREASLISKF